MIQDVKQSVPCKYCGTPTVMTGTQQCDNCWEVSSRAAKMNQATLTSILLDVRQDVLMVDAVQAVVESVAAIEKFRIKEIIVEWSDTSIQEIMARNPRDISSIRRVLISGVHP